MKGQVYLYARLLAVHAEMIKDTAGASGALIFQLSLRVWVLSKRRSSSLHRLPNIVSETPYAQEQT